MNDQWLGLEWIRVIGVIWPVYKGGSVCLVDVEARVGESKWWDWLRIVIFDKLGVVSLNPC